MFKVLIFLFAIAFVNGILRIRSNDFCYKTNKVGCSYEFNYTCDNEHCTKNPKLCNQLKEMKTFIRSVPFKKLLDKKYICIIENISSCQKNKKLPISEVCILKDKLKCTGEYNYKCESNLCSRSRATCIGFQVKNLKKRENYSQYTAKHCN